MPQSNASYYDDNFGLTWRVNPVTISLSLLVGAGVFITAFVAATIQGEAKW
jgi:hypothetical protein